MGCFTNYSHYSYFLNIRPLIIFKTLHTLPKSCCKQSNQHRKNYFATEYYRISKIRQQSAFYLIHIFYIVNRNPFLKCSSVDHLYDSSRAWSVIKQEYSNRASLNLAFFHFDDVLIQHAVCFKIVKANVCQIAR